MCVCVCVLYTFCDILCGGGGGGRGTEEESRKKRIHLFKWLLFLAVLFGMILGFVTDTF